MNEGTGTIQTIKNGGSEGVIVEDGSNAPLEFINPRIPNINVGDRFGFLKIIQSTPNGEKVVIVLTGKLPT